jgi:hypothetical protein
MSMKIPFNIVDSQVDLTITQALEEICRHEKWWWIGRLEMVVVESRAEQRDCVAN